MLGIHDFTLFVGSALLLNLTPGADMLYVMSRAANGGAGNGLAATAGIGTGCLVHTTLAALGLSALLAASARAFLLVRLAGACYLVALGVGLLLKRSPSGAPDPGTPPKHDIWRAYRQGVLVNALNPKVGLFFLAFLPQFIQPHGFTLLPFMLLGCVFVGTSSVVNAAVAFAAAPLRRWTARSGAALRWPRRLLGIAFIGFGLKLARYAHP